MSAPIQLYLDSSDISKLSNPRFIETDPLRAIYRYLKQRVADEEVTVRFSVIHIAELAHTAPSAQGSCYLAGTSS